MIMKSKNNINLAVKDIASYNIYRHLIRACERGVKIKILADKESFQSKASFLYALKMSCVDVITSPINEESNHFGIFDGKKILTGSYSWSDSGVNSSADCLIFAEQDVVDKYSKRFRLLNKEYSANG